MFGSRALLVLRKDPRSRNIATLYLFASGSGIAACAVRMITALIPPLQGTLSAGLVWFFVLLVRRRFRPDLCAVLAAEGQMVPGVGAASLAMC